MPNLKLGLTICVKLEKPLENETVKAFFNSPMGRISCKISDEEYMQHMDALMTQLNVFATGGSGWVVKTLNRLEIETVCCSNVTGNSYIETPALLKPLKNSLLNVVNKRDNFRFLYCIVSTRGSCQCLHPLFLRSKNVTMVPLMSINWKIPS